MNTFTASSMKLRSLAILGVLALSAVNARGQDGNETPDPNLESINGKVKLEAGFEPDPFLQKLTAGGPIKTKLGGVDAYVTKAPSFRLYYNNAGKYVMTMQVASSAETTLLVNLPDGSWIADARGPAKATLRFTAPQSGRYDIFVGTRSKDAAPAVLKITEMKVEEEGQPTNVFVGTTRYKVLTLKYKTPDACQNALASIRKDFKESIYPLTTFASFADVFVLDSGKASAALPTTDLEWSEHVSYVMLPGPLPTPVANARGEAPPEKIIADDRARVFGKTGKNVLLAVIDTGIDYRHEDFCTKGADGKKESRLLYYWDTTARTSHAGDEGTTKLLATFPNGKAIGHLYSRKNVTDELNQNPTNGPPNIATDDHGHGTGCAAVAAGRGRANGSVKPGVAPDADLIMVRMSNMYMLNAICEWLERVAKDQNKPLVISLSQGTAWGGGYDGMRGQDQHLNARFALDKKGFAACLCAGNEGRGEYSTFVELDPDGAKTTTITWNSPQPGELVFYFDTPELKDITIQGPQADMIKPLYHAASKTWRTAEFQVPQGKGEITITAAGSRKVGVDAYIVSGHPMRNKGIIRSDRGPDMPSKRINSPATIPNSITVGSYNWAEPYDGATIGWLSPYSSPGPRRGSWEKTAAAPWLVSPGHKFTVPKPNVPGVSEEFNGTSAATPYTAGVVALMFECNKNLTFGQVRELLAQQGCLTRNDKTIKDAYGKIVVQKGSPDYPNAYWGYGKLDVPAARRILSKLLDEGAATGRSAP